MEWRKEITIIQEEDRGKRYVQDRRGTDRQELKKKNYRSYAGVIARSTKR